jgi:hypothetical protein
MRAAMLGGVGLVVVAVALSCSTGSGGGFGAGDAGGDGTLGDGGDDGGGGDGAVGPCSGGCTAGQTCCAGACVVASSCSFAVTSLTPSQGWQDGGDWLTLKGAGFAAGMRVFLGDGRAPARVVDAQTVKIQTPPGPVGATDVTVQLGAQKATLPKAFLYNAGALMAPWSEKPMMSVRGEWPALAVLQDGRVLVAGGVTTPDMPATSLATAEIFDRPSETLTPVASTMSTPRWRSAAVTLLDGTVLVVGGACWDDLSGCVGDATTADIYDPATGKFTPTKAPLGKPRVNVHAVLLADGRVLVSSGNDASVEIYDPAAQSFTLAMPMGPHDTGPVVRLRDGRVLLIAGLDANGGMAAVEAFDSDAGTFTAVGSLMQPRYWPTAVVTPGGEALVMGGASGNTGAWTPLDSIELFDPTSNTFATASYKLLSPRYGGAASLVRDGTVVAMGGYSIPSMCSSLVDTVDQIDPVKATVTAFATLPHKNTELNAVTLLDGSVIAVGGGACGSSFAMPYVDFLPGKPSGQ